MYLVGEGVLVPEVSADNRAPDEADVAAAYAELGPDEVPLIVDSYRNAPDDQLTVALRGSIGASLAFLMALAKRCGQLYVFGFPYDAMPGIVVDPADDLDMVLRRMAPETRAMVTADLASERSR